MSIENPIKFVKGTGKSAKAQFVFGSISVPASAFTRIEKEARGKTEAAINRIFITGLGKKYQSFLELLEENGISYQEAFELMKNARPVKTLTGGITRSRTKKEAQAIARVLCRKYLGKTPQDMVAAFIETVKSEEFASEIVTHIQLYEENYKRTEKGRIRVRPEREGMKEQALVAQQARKAKAATAAKKK